jgi:hypothetical protein
MADSACKLVKQVDNKHLLLMKHVTTFSVKLIPQDVINHRKLKALAVAHATMDHHARNYH